MPRQSYKGFPNGSIIPSKTRKRVCSPSSSTSSIIHSSRLNKRAISVGHKNRVGRKIGSRSNTPVAINTPKYSHSGSTRPVSARRLAATLWGINEMPSTKISENNFEVMNCQKKKKNGGSKMMVYRNLPPHLSDPMHSPTISDKMDRSVTGSRRMRTPSISQRLRYADQDVGVFDSISNASLMEIETRSQAPTPSLSGDKNRLKDVSNSLTTSKELLKIMNRIWVRSDQTTSTKSLVSALHTELERARLQVNQFLQEQHYTDKIEINHLINHFNEEKSRWKNKEQQIISELESERKLRRRVENLNKKLGQELSEIKSSFMKAVKEIESEKRAREITEQVCDELAMNIEELKRDTFKVQEEVEKEREMLELADKLREERVQMKLSEAKHQFEEKNSAVNKLRKQLEVFLGTRRDREGDGEVEDVIDSDESELHSIELNIDDYNKNNKGYKWAHGKFRDDEIESRKSISEKYNVLSCSKFPQVRDYEEKYHAVEPNISKSRMADVRGEAQSLRRSKW